MVKTTSPKPDQSSAGIHNQTIGKWGENQAEEFLVRKGYEIVDKNYRTPEGEIDLICQHDGDLVFVEVKTRSNTNMGYPEEAVTAEKWSHLVSTAELYLADHPDTNQNWRVDIIAIIGSRKSGLIDLTHFENYQYD